MARHLRRQTRRSLRRRVRPATGDLEVAPGERMVAKHSCEGGGAVVNAITQGASEDPLLVRCGADARS
jgi:hypothetical protein